MSICAGSGRKAWFIWSRPICPVCHHTTAAKLPKLKGSRKTIIVPNHDTPGEGK